MANDEMKKRIKSVITALDMYPAIDDDNDVIIMHGWDFNGHMTVIAVCWQRTMTISHSRCFGGWFCPYGDPQFPRSIITT